jgi:hypothetical protein
MSPVLLLRDRFGMLGFSAFSGHVVVFTYCKFRRMKRAHITYPLFWARDVIDQGWFQLLCGLSGVFHRRVFIGIHSRFNTLLLMPAINIGWIIQGGWYRTVLNGERVIAFFALHRNGCILVNVRRWFRTIPKPWGIRGFRSLSP